MFSCEILPPHSFATWVWPIWGGLIYNKGCLSNLMTTITEDICSLMQHLHLDFCRILFKLISFVVTSLLDNISEATSIADFIILATSQSSIFNVHCSSHLSCGFHQRFPFSGYVHCRLHFIPNFRSRFCQIQLLHFTHYLNCDFPL